MCITDSLSLLSSPRKFLPHLHHYFPFKQEKMQTWSHLTLTAEYCSLENPRVFKHPALDKMSLKHRSSIYKGNTCLLHLIHGTKSFNDIFNGNMFSFYSFLCFSLFYLFIFYKIIILLHLAVNF